MKLAMSGLLIAIGLIIPMFSPVRILIEPASFTLASHVAIFIAMFISPTVAVAVAAGTTLGFLFGGFPIIVVLRAATHIGFAFMGSFYIHEILMSNFSAIKLRVFSLCVAAVHAVSELVVVSVFYMGGNVSFAHIEQGFVMSVLLLVGLGTVIHSMIDFEIANIILYPLKKQKTLSGYFQKI
jgi:niacin transporter